MSQLSRFVPCQTPPIGVPARRFLTGLPISEAACVERACRYPGMGKFQVCPRKQVTVKLHLYILTRQATVCSKIRNVRPSMQQSHWRPYSRSRLYIVTPLAALSWEGGLSSTPSMHTMFVRHHHPPPAPYAGVFASCFSFLLAYPMWRSLASHSEMQYVNHLR